MYKKFTELFFRRDFYAIPNLILKMKITCVLLFVVLLQIQAKSVAQKVNLSVKDASLSTVISKIKQQTDYDFIYNNETVEGAKPITVNAKNLDLKSMLDRCFKEQPFEYEVINKVIVLTRKKQRPSEIEILMPGIIVPAQKVSGTVKDAATGETLIGVSIGVEGTTTGTNTDNNGNFSLTVPSAASVLVFSYLGYETQKVTVNDQATLDIKLVKAENKLSDVVVVGYGTRAKGAITGAISTVKSDVFESRPENNVFDALQGAVPGVTITRKSGQPGNQGYNLQVRGYSSINGNVPLVLIDGIPGDFGTLNPNDISEISVLKDAAAAIYGARAADGVIIVTTKKGKKGAPVVQYSANVGLKTPAYLKKMMNTLQFAHFLSDGLVNAGVPGFPQSVFDNIQNNAAPDLTKGWNYGLPSYPSFYGYTDWNKVIYKNSIQQLHNISVSGGGDNNNYLISAGYNRDNGSFNYGVNYSDRYNLRLNYDIRPFKNLSVETRTSLEKTETKDPTMIGNALPNVVRQFPYAPVYNQVGEFYGYQGYENPAQSLSEGGEHTFDFSRINTNFKADYHVIDGLTLTGQAAIRLDFSDDNAITKTFTRYNYVGAVQDIRNTPNSATYKNSQTNYRLYQVYADYNKQFGSDHKINLTVGTSLEQTNDKGQSVTGYNFPGNQIFTLNLADKTSAAFINYTGNLSDETLNSYFGRFSYSYKEKLIIDVTGPADGSSKFSPDKRWSSLFPSVALAYNLSSENFIKKLDFFDQLKIRASWGKMGNQDITSLGLFDYIPLITVPTLNPNNNNNPYIYPLGSPNVSVPGAAANPASANRTWETIENKNIGLDVQILRSRLTFSFDYFNKTNNDMLVNIAVPATYGGTAPTSNQGKLATKGFETTINWKDHINDFRYSIAVQLSDNTNKLVALANTDSYSEGKNQFRQGYPINSYFGYVYDGIIKTQAQLDNYKKLQGVPAHVAIGDVMYKDVDGDGKLTEFGDKSKGLNGDMVYLGNANPRYTYSSNINLGYKQFDLSIFIQGVGKRNIQYGGPLATPNAFFWPTLAYYYNKTYSAANPNAQYPRYLPGSVGFDDVRGYDYHTSSLTMQNDAYLRFKVITLSYTLPASVINAVKIKSARIYFSGQDLFTISKGTLGGNYDPEDGNMDESTYPFNKVYSLGLDIKF
ncbi:SusC/RagA family TonB-linked outer membrane protein [Mucilaginibacter corticis]|uniref:SusC/RagA family TonB-linked outer membrane protein n=1 Tax=Mucilaginibacter corticis TaxID=2597670 RepID=A0A556MS81_9SPHI|nr:SusC/RagA family TonB-linked outer membrane protein [Mucilaginibacter corticis]TSJ42639.1 SusC/RagA family TonB-linked outer membrane protein [Mucilaginibacter corticis]